MAKNMGRQKNLLAANEVIPCNQVGHVFLSFGGGWGVGSLLFPMCSHELSFLFPSNSPCILSMFSKLQCVCNHVPSSSSLYPISFALCSILVAYITWSKEEITKHLFWDCSKHDLFFCDRPIKDAH